MILDFIGEGSVAAPVVIDRALPVLEGEVDQQGNQFAAVVAEHGKVFSRGRPWSSSRLQGDDLGFILDGEQHYPLVAHDRLRPAEIHRLPYPGLVQQNNLFGRCRRFAN